MKTFQQSGDILPYTNGGGSTVTSGTVVLQGGLVGVVTGDILAGATGSRLVRGVVSSQPTDTGTAWNDGDQLYWDNTNLRFTKVANGNTFAGHSVGGKTSGATTSTVRLQPNTQIAPGEFAGGNSGAAPAVDWNNGDSQTFTVTANATFTFANGVKGKLYRLKLVQDATGARTYTWPAAVKWTGGTAPTGSAANKVDIVEFYFDSTNYFGRSNLNY